MGHHGHHHQKEEKPQGQHHETSYASQGPAYGGAIQSYAQELVKHSYAEEHKHQKHEHAAEAVALGAGALAMYERHEVKVDPQHAGRHRREERIAEVAAVGASGYALHEHHQVRHDRHQIQAAGYSAEPSRKDDKKHHHGLFY